MLKASRGSLRTPSAPVWVMTSGFEMPISNPSRRIVSIRIASCSSPRPRTLKESAESVGSTRIETLVSSSSSSRSLMLRDVTQRRARRGRGDGLADLDAVEARERHDLAAVGLVGVDALEAVEDVELGDPGRL